MKVSEKSLELNVGAELLFLMRWRWGMPKTYLRGLTQHEEKKKGVDFFVQLDSRTRLFAFQFKAPKGSADTTPYRYKLVREQHDLLFSLAAREPNSVFYVFPFYVTDDKLQRHVPILMQDTWMLNILQMPTAEVFGALRTRTVSCVAGCATVNPDFALHPLSEMQRPQSDGISVGSFIEWYTQHLARIDSAETVRRNPWLTRGLQLAIITP